MTVTVSDGDLDAEASFAWNVSQPNRAPSLGAIGNQSVAEGASLPLTLSATDLDTDALAFSASLDGDPLPAWIDPDRCR